MLNQSLPSYKAETTIQNIIQYISSSVKLLIYKAFSAHRVPRSTIRYYFISHLLQYKTYFNLLHLL